LGAVDFAGGTVIHLLAGVSGLVVALYLGPIRKNGHIEPHSSPTHWLGVAFLWAGWMAFNGASAYAANIAAAQAIYNTAMGGASGYLMYMILEGTCGTLENQGNSVEFRRSPSSQAVGGLYGLIAVTPAAGYVGAGAAILIGLISATVNYFVTQIFLQVCKCSCGNIIKEHDFLDVFVFHGLSGFTGTLLTGLLYCNPLLTQYNFFAIQLLSAAVTIGWGIVTTIICLLCVTFCYHLLDKLAKCCSCNCDNFRKLFTIEQQSGEFFFDSCGGFIGSILFDFSKHVPNQVYSVDNEYYGSKAYVFTQDVIIDLQQDDRI